MAYKNIKIEELELNKDNIRHGALASGEKAMEWWLKHDFKGISELCCDIAYRGKLDEPLLVEKIGSKYLVHDGNRRVTCLKVLSNNIPDDLDKEVLRKLKLALPTNYSFIPFDIHCRIESDAETIDEILEARHISGKTGASQKSWTASQKDIFYERKDDPKRVGFARQLGMILASKKLIKYSKNINLLVVETLFEKDDNKERIGFRVTESNEIEFIKNSDKVLEALRHIIEDENVYNHLFVPEKQKKYFSDLENKGILPSEKDVLTAPKIIKYKDIVKKIRSAEEKKTAKPIPKENFFSKKFPVLKETEHLSPKMLALFNEFNKKLNVEKHSISMVIVFRSVLEILVYNYIEKHDLLFGYDDKAKKKITLNKKVEMVANHLKTEKDFKNITTKALGKFSDYKFLGSLQTINDVIHNDFDMPPSNLKALGRELEEYFRRIVEDLNKEEKNSNKELPF